MKEKFISFGNIADYNYGVKGFEIRFQDEIERVLKGEGLDAIWWKYYSGSIFNEVFTIYQVAQNDDYDLLTRLSELYDTIINEVSCRVELDKVVSMDERIKKSFQNESVLRNIDKEKEER